MTLPSSALRERRNSPLFLLWILTSSTSAPDTLAHASQPLSTRAQARESSGDGFVYACVLCVDWSTEVD